MLNKQLTDIDSLINQVSGNAPNPDLTNDNVIANPETKEVVFEKPEIITPIVPPQVEVIPVSEPTQLYNFVGKIDSLGIDATGYNENSSWVEKVDFIVRNSPKALKRGDITMVLRAIDKKLKVYEDKLLFPTLAPYLSKMASDKKLIMANDFSLGSFYIHPSWVENGAIKPEFKDRCPEKLRFTRI